MLRYWYFGGACFGSRRTRSSFRVSVFSFQENACGGRFGSRHARVRLSFSLSSERKAVFHCAWGGRSVSRFKKAKIGFCPMRTAHKESPLPTPCESTQLRGRDFVLFPRDPFALCECRTNIHFNTISNCKLYLCALNLSQQHATAHTRETRGF